MNLQTFSLKPFEAGKPHSGTGVTGSICRQADKLRARYRLAGNLSGIEIPGRKQRPGRVTGLWEGTCFELFLAIDALDQYWEINVSPSGDWNVFRFARYKEERRIESLEEEPLVDSLISTTRTRPDSLLLEFELHLNGIVRGDQPLVIGVSAVIKGLNTKTHWALTHCDAKPNFHRRESFIMKL
jgi:hypothetical protein